MRLDFLALEIENFKSFSNKQVIDFTQLGTGLHFLCGRNEVEPRLGSNGAGKTSVLDCLVWILYGVTPAGLKNTDVKPWMGDKVTTRGSLTIGVDDAEHVIERTANPNKLKLDGKEVGQGAIIDLIEMSYDLFTQSILMAQGQPLFLDLPPGDKMALFVNALSLDRWDRRSQDAATRTRSLEKLEGEIREDIAATEGALDEVEASTKEVKERSREWESKRQERLSKVEADLAAALKAQETISKRYDKADLAYDSAMTDLKLITLDVDKLEEACAEARRTYDRASAELATCGQQVKTFEGELSGLGDGSSCPTCGQKMKGTSLDKHRREVEEQIQTLKARIKAGVPAKTRSALDKVEDQLAKLKQSRSEIRERADLAGSERDSLHPRRAEANAAVTALRSRVSQDSEETNPFLEQLSGLRTRRAKLLKDEKDLNKELKLTLEDIEHFKFWIKGFRDVRLYIVDEVLEDLEVAANAMLEEMGLVGWQMRFDPERETKSGTVSRGINVTVLSPTNKDVVRWQSWSGGEGQRLRLVGSLALAEVLLNHAGVECSFEALDEPTRHLSQEGIRDIHEFLADRARRLDKQVLYVDHAAISSRYFDSTITVVKDAKGSHFQFV